MVRRGDTSSLLLEPLALGSLDRPPPSPTTRGLLRQELGYVKIDPRGAELLFQIITEREERASIAIATNLPFSEWGTVFPDPRLVAAIVDRVTFNAHILAVVEVGFDGVEAWSGVGGDGEELAADAGVFVGAAGAVGADAVAELDAAAPEVVGEDLESSRDLDSTTFRWRRGRGRSVAAEGREFWTELCGQAGRASVRSRCGSCGP